MPRSRAASRRSRQSISKRRRARGAAALSFAYFDMTYTLCALIVVLEKRILPAYLPGQGKPGALA